MFSRAAWAAFHGATRLRRTPRATAGALLFLALIGADSLWNEARAANAANGATLWSNAGLGCAGCHGATPANPQLNAATAPGVILHATQNVAQMVTFGYSSVNPNATQRDDLAAYIAQQTTTLSQSKSVNYHSSVSIPLDITLNLPASVLVPAVGTTSLNALGVTGNNNGSVTFPTSTYNSGAGTANLNLSSASYTHTANNCNGETITVTATGPGGPSAGRVIAITVTAPAAPTVNSYTAASIAYSTVSTTLTAPTLGGGPTASLSIVSPPATGTAGVSGLNLSYASAATYVPQRTFTYQAIGPCGAVSAAGTVTVNITTPTPTTLNPTTSAAFNSGAPVTTTTIDIPALIGAVPGVVTGVSVTAQPATGSAVAAGTNVNFTPLAGEFNTVRTFDYQTSGPGSSFTGRVTVNVGAAGAPVITPASPAFSVPYNAGGAGPSTIDLATVISGALQSPNPITINTAPTRGSGIAAGPSASTTLNYTPNAGNLTADSFSFTAFAPGGASTSATVTINITPPGPPTITQPINVSVPFNSGGAAPTPINLAPFLSGTLAANPINITAIPALGTGITAGALTGTTVSYTPLQGSLASQTFQFTAAAPGGATSAVATVNIAITPPAPPTAAAKSVSTPINTAVAIDLTASVSGIFSSIAVAGAPANGSTQLAGNIVTYTPNANFTGTDTFTYTATGPGGTSAPATVTVTVARAIAGPVQMTVPLNTPTTVDLAPNITGVGVTGIAIATAPRFGTAGVSGTKVTYTPRTNYFGADSFTYIAFATGGSSAPATVTVTVVGRPDPTQDATVTGLLSAMSDTARRFSSTQISNVQRRLETLRRGPNTSAGATAGESRPERPVTGRAAAAAAPDESFAVARPERGAVQMPMAQEPVARAFMLSGSGADAVGSNDPAREAAAMKLRYSTASSESPLPEAGDAGLGLKLMALGTELAQAVTSGKVGLSGSTTSGDKPGSTTFWSEGVASFGSRDASGSRTGLEFSTSGLTFGVDRRISDKLVVGAGLGFGRDKTDIGNDGSNTRAQSVSVAGYASYQPSAKTFVDGLLGVSSLSYDTNRFVAPVTDFARASRSGNSLFGSLGAGYEQRGKGWLLSPYGRFDFSFDRLKDATESGAGAFALTYFGNTSRMLQASLGLRGETVHEANFGFVMPRARIEYRHDFQGDRLAQISYADQIGGPRYAFSTGAVDRDALVLGLGSDFLLRNGLTFGFDYQYLHSTEKTNIQSLRARLAIPLDGRRISPWIDLPEPGKPLDIQVDLGYTYDDNISRASSAADILADRSYSLNLSKSWVFPLSAHVRGIVLGGLGGEKFHSYTGLDRLSASVQGDLEYRPSAQFTAPTFTLTGRAVGDKFDSTLRTGHRYTLGVSVLQPVTDRITLLGGLNHNQRYGKSAVFDTSENAARVNVDYAVMRGHTVYLSGEYRRGDIVSTARPTLANLDIATVFAPDDVFSNAGYVSYRFPGKTVIGTLGYNIGFGPRDSLDFSWRRVQSLPTVQNSFPTAGFRYVVNQYNLVYLLRF
jgi:outer membrane autotransporter protein